MYGSPAGSLHTPFHLTCWQCCGAGAADLRAAPEPELIFGRSEPRTGATAIILSTEVACSLPFVSPSS